MDIRMNMLKLDPDSYRRCMNIYYRCNVLDELEQKARWNMVRRDLYRNLECKFYVDVKDCFEPDKAKILTEKQKKWIHKSHEHILKQVFQIYYSRMHPNEYYDYYFMKQAGTSEFKRCVRRHSQMEKLPPVKFENMLTEVLLSGIIGLTEYTHNSNEIESRHREDMDEFANDFWKDCKYANSSMRHQ